MAQINIKASTVSITEKRAAELCSILAELGVEFICTPTKNPNPQDNKLLKDINMCVRAQRVMKIACETVNLDWNTTTTKQFAETVSLDTLRKIRNCGKRALEEIQNVLYRFGYSLA